MTTKIEISKIDVPSGRRKLDPDWVETLANLFTMQGQQTAIQVLATGDRYQLVFGGHRLAAAIRKGWTEIDGEIKTREDFANEADIVLSEITENMGRRDLSMLDRSVDIMRWREAYEAAHTVSKGGRRAKNNDQEEQSAKFALSFSEAAQKVFHLSRRSVFLATKIAGIPAAIRDRIALHAIADNQSELLLLADQDAPRQERVVALLTAEPPQASSVSDAIAIIDRLPKAKKEPAWQKVSTSFSSLKEADQDRFFELHEAAVQRWLKGRSS